MALDSLDTHRNPPEVNPLTSSPSRRSVDCTIGTRGPLDGLSVASSVHVSVLASARNGVAAVRIPESVTDLVVNESNSPAAGAGHAKTRAREVS
jgi:hypothetical protein